MSNPIPQFHVPDTRPGYAFQDPGAGGAVAGGIQAVLAALLQRQKQEQAQAEFQLEQQRAAQNASYQNTLLAQEQARQDAARQAALAQAMGDRQVGQAVQSIGQPSTVNVQLPYNIGGGANLPMPVGPQVTPDQAMQSLDPALVVPFEAAAKRQITDYQKGQDEAKATRQKAATETAIRGVLPGLKPMFKKVDELLAANPEADPTAVREAVVAAYGSQPDPAVLAAIDKQHPEWSHLPGAERVKLAFNYEDEKIKARFRPATSGAGPGTKDVPVSIMVRLKANDAAVTALEDAINQVTNHPRAFGLEMGYGPMRWLADQTEPHRNPKSPESIARAAVEGAALLQIYDRSGQQINMTELTKSGDIPRVGDPPALIKAKLQKLLLRAKEGNMFLRSAYSPDRGFKPMLGDTPTAQQNIDRTAEAMNAQLPPYRPKGMTP